MRTALAWMALALLAGIAAVVAGSLWQHRLPPPRLLRILESTHVSSELAQAWIRAAVPPETGPAGTPALHRGDLVPDLSLPDLEGHAQSLSQWRGKRILLNFWASWCAPCRREMPDLVAAQTRYGPHKVQIVGIALDHPEAVRAFLVQHPVNYPILLGLDASWDPSHRFGNTLGALPFSVLIGTDGRVEGTYYGALQPAQLRWWLAD